MISDTTGYFQTVLEGNDTLVFMCLGYLGEVYFVQESPEFSYPTIRMVPYQYPIEEVNITRYRYYNQFRQEFLRVQPKKDLEIAGLPKPNYRDIPLLLDTNVLRSTEFLVFHPISYLYYNFSKEEKSKRRVFYLERKQREQVVIDRKYNCELVEKITGLNEEEILKFMWFCNFSHQFLYEASELEIVQKIDEKFQEYKKTSYGTGVENTNPE